MRKVILCFVVLLFVVFVGAMEESLSPSENADVSVIVDGDVPEIIIYNPINTTYSSLSPILVNYTVIDVTHQATWYSLNGASNMSVVGLFDLNLGEGDYDLIIYANDSLGKENSSEVSFSVNDSVVFCGNDVCDLQEDCNSCSGDCGVCEAPAPPPSSGGGGSGSSGKKSGTSFEVDKGQIKVRVKEGETQREIIKVTNTGNNKVRFRIEETFFEEIIIFDERNFELNPGEERSVIVDFIAGNIFSPSLYVGEIIVKSGQEEISVLTAIEIVSRDILFDIKLEIPEPYYRIVSGEKVLAEVSIFSVGKEDRVDTEINYQIMNHNGDIIFEQREFVSVDVESTFVRYFDIPEETPSGDYILYASVNYKDNVGSASQWFEIVSKVEREQNLNIIVILLIIVIILVIISISTKYGSGRKKFVKRKKYLKDKKVVKEEKKVVKEEKKVVKRFLKRPQIKTYDPSY